MLVKANSPFRFTRRSLLQTAVTVVPGLPVAGTLTQAIAQERSIESLGITIFNYDRNGRSLLCDLSHSSHCGSTNARVLLSGRVSHMKSYTSQLRKDLFDAGRGIIDLFNRDGDAVFNFLEAIPPSDVLRASVFFDPPDDSITSTGGRFVHVNHRLDENKKSFAQNPDIHKYIETGNYCQSMVGHVPITDLAEMLFESIRTRVRELYSLHFNVAKFLYFIEHRRDISIRHNGSILKLLGERYAQFKGLVIRNLTSEFDFDAKERIRRKEEVQPRERLAKERKTQNQNRLERQDSSKIADSKQEPKLEVDKPYNFLTFNDRQVLAGVYNTATGRFLKEEADSPTIGNLCFDLDLDSRFKSSSYKTAAQAAIEIGITKGYENYEYEF